MRRAVSSDSYSSPRLPGSWSSNTAKKEVRERLMSLIPALRTISYLRNLPEDHDYVRDELAGIVLQVEHERTVVGQSGRFGVVRETFSRGNARRLITGCLISESQIGASPNNSDFLPNGRDKCRELLLAPNFQIAGFVCQ